MTRTFTVTPQLSPGILRRTDNPLFKPAAHGNTITPAPFHQPAPGKNTIPAAKN
jgi:hypothetical protein